MLDYVTNRKLNMIQVHTKTHVTHMKLNWGRRSVVGYDGGLASEWLPVRTLPCAVSLALRRRPCGVAILSGYLINSWAIPNFKQLFIRVKHRAPVSRQSTLDKLERPNHTMTKSHTKTTK